MISINSVFLSRDNPNRSTSLLENTEDMAKTGIALISADQ